MRLDPLETCHPLTGAVRAITPSLLSETYLSPRTIWDADRLSALADAPWSGSLLAAPEATRSALESGLVRVMRATRRLGDASGVADAGEGARRLGRGQRILRQPDQHRLHLHRVDHRRPELESRQSEASVERGAHMCSGSRGF
ncbi:MAG: hypothetical protein CML46_15275 [Rhodobacteraceae bacterium]|nr:hypothetical protein [Paracoccaceae bacterium]MBR28285.1 hypothetical protein [Paracoccaceae bacterium]